MISCLAVAGNNPAAGHKIATCFCCSRTYGGRHGDVLLQATRAAVQVMVAAVASTGEASKQVDSTLHELQLLQASSGSALLAVVCRDTGM